MNAHLIFDNELQRIRKIIKSNENSYIIIASDINLNFESLNLGSCQILKINFFSNDKEEEIVKITDQLSKFLDMQIRCSENIAYDISEILVNSIFTNTTILYNLTCQLNLIIEKYNIKMLYLYGGSNNYSYPIGMAEGERNRVFLYSRSSFLNKYVYEAFKEITQIEWKQRIPSLIGKLMTNIRPFLMLGAQELNRTFTIVKNMFKKKSYIEELKANQKRIFLMVRSSIQVEPLIPIYERIKNDIDFEPLFITYENYSNYQLKEVLNNYGVEYYDLLENLKYSTMRRLSRQARKIVKQNNSVLVIKIGETPLKVDTKTVSKNLLPFVFDALIIIDVLNIVGNHELGAKALINNETHGYQSATTANWCANHNIKTYGIQHVAIGNKLLPRVSRVDEMFVMTSHTKNELKKLKPDERFESLGPISYDFHYNTQSSSGDKIIVSVFTQPDQFTDMYIELIKDVILLVEKHKNIDYLYIKLHPREKNKTRFERLTFGKSYIKIVAPDFDSNKLIKQSNFVISVHSSIILQSIIIGTPTISMNYSNKVEIKFDYVNDPVTHKVCSFIELEEALKDLNSVELIFRENRKKYLDKNFQGYRGNASGKFFEYMKEDISNEFSN